MKRLLLLLVFISFASFSQSFQEAYEANRQLPITEINGMDLGTYNQLTGNPNEWSKVMGILYEFDDIRFAKVGTDGTFLLHEDWNQSGVIMVGERKYLVPNMNFHIGRDELMSKADNDSIFLFDLNTLDEFSFQNKRFKRYQDNRDGIYKVYEVVFDSRDISLLKRHSAELIKADPDPMKNRLRNKIVKKESFLIQKNGLMSDFSLKKSGYYNLIDKNQRKEFQSKVQVASLSFTDENDAPSILRIIADLNDGAAK